MAQRRGAPIALLEDSEHDAFFVRRALEKAQIVNPIICFTTATDARAHFDEARHAAIPALFVMDIHLAGGETSFCALRYAGVV